jgi:hypothetical protein
VSSARNARVNVRWRENIYPWARMREIYKDSISAIIEKGISVATDV